MTDKQREVFVMYYINEKNWNGKITSNFKLPMHDGNIDRPDDEGSRIFSLSVMANVLPATLLHLLILQKLKVMISCLMIKRTENDNTKIHKRD